MFKNSLDGGPNDNRQSPSERLVRVIRRATRKQYSAEEKIRIVLEDLRGEVTISELCRGEGIAKSLYYSWSKEFLEAGKRRLAGHTVRAATANEVKQRHGFSALTICGDLRVFHERRLGRSVAKAREDTCGTIASAAANSTIRARHTMRSLVDARTQLSSVARVSGSSRISVASLGCFVSHPELESRLARPAKPPGAIAGPA